MDERIYFYKDLPLSYCDPNNFIGSGFHGKVYRISDDKIFKHIEDVSKSKRSYEYLVSQTSFSFVFPDTLVYLRDEFVGYIAKYINGVSFREMSTDVLLDDFLSALVLIEKEIREKSMTSMRFHDLIPDNMIWTYDKQLKVIDTDLYEYDDSFYELHELYFKNLSGFNETILSKIFDSYYLGIGSDTLNKYFRMCLLEGKMTVSKFLGYLIDYLGNMTLYPIKTIKDVQDNLSLVRKR